MATAGCILFGFRVLQLLDVENRKVLEVGSKDVNGGLRRIVESLGPDEYVGIDIEPGPGVDRVCRAEDLVDTFGEESFDIVISTEMIEHVRDWRSAISNMKRVCRRKGLIILTTRSIGFAYHAFPSDFWRYEPEDIKAIFSDMELVALERDSPESPGVMARIRKPLDFRENDLSGLHLYSIVDHERIPSLDDIRLRRFLQFKQLRTALSRILAKVGGG